MGRSSFLSLYEKGLGGVEETERGSTAVRTSVCALMVLAAAALYEVCH